MHIFRRIFLSNYWWQESDIWSQASYRYAILWEAVLDPSDFYFLFADLVGFYTHWTYMHIFRHIFLSNYWWQRSDIWSQVSYRYPISCEAFLDPSDSYFLFAEERGYHKWALAHSSSCSSHFSQQLLMAEICYFFTIFILVRNIVGCVFGPVRFLIPVFQLNYTPAPRRGRGVYCFTSVRLSFRPSKIFFVAFFSITVDGRNLILGFYAHWTYMLIFLSNYWWQKSDIWSQASYRYPISWEAFLDPSDSYFLFVDFVDFYTHLTYICICLFFVAFF